jgi:BMFP domain-containing protein YqiC
MNLAEWTELKEKLAQLEARVAALETKKTLSLPPKPKAA